MNNLEIIVRALDEKLGMDIVAIDMAGTSPLYDCFVICSANNERQLQALKNNLIEQGDKVGYFPKRIEGKKESTWVLVDFGDVVVHLFNEEDRSNYGIEKLWSDHKTIDISEYIK